jgi:O-6-methylguanine DNA methyltransferase
MWYSNIETPIGTVQAIADKDFLVGLRYTDFLKGEGGEELIPGETAPIRLLKKELVQYFKGKLKSFQTPVMLMGTVFQQRVWEGLRAIPYGQTRSYQDHAVYLGKPNACRAVGNANGANPIAIVIPCHRVIAHNGTLGGYSSGLHRKKWLLEHEGSVYDEI